MDSTQVFARTLWGEARSEGTIGMAAVAAVIINRVQVGGWWGNDIKQVCLQPYQFSCWNKSDPNLPKMRRLTSKDPDFIKALTIARLAEAGLLKDPTNGATHYHTIWVSPNWAKGKGVCFSRGSHLFYKNI